MDKEALMRLPLRERNKQRVIQRIQEAAFELFRTVGYDQTTMDVIAERAETSRGTLFNYFPTKGSLWIPFLKAIYLEHVQPQVNEYLRSEPSTLQALQFLFTCIYDRIFQFPEMDHAFRALQEEVFHKHPQNADINQGTGFIDNIQSILQHGQQQGDIRTDIPLEQLTRYVTVLYLSHVTELVKRNDSSEYLQEIDFLLAFINSGLQ